MKNLGSILLKAVLTIVIIGLIYLLYDSLFSRYNFAQEKERRYLAIKERMNDIIQVQETYRKLTGRYAGDFDVLIATVKNESIMIVRTIGTESDTIKALSVSEAVALFEIDPNQPDSVLIKRIEKKLDLYNQQLKRTGGDAITTYVVRDTTYTPALNTISMASPIDSIKYIPYGKGETFSLNADSIVVGAGRVLVPTYEVEAYNYQFLKDENAKYYKRKEGIRLGSTTEASTDIVDIVIRKED